MKNGWVVFDEDGVFVLTDKVIHATKRDAIFEVSVARLDDNEKPKVKRLREGVYWYYPRDCDSGEYGDVYTIQRLDTCSEEQLRDIEAEIKELEE